MALFPFWKEKQTRKESPGPDNRVDRGILVFENTGEVIQAETLLKKGGWEILGLIPAT